MSVTIIFKHIRELVPLAPNAPLNTAFESFCAKHGLSPGSHGLFTSNERSRIRVDASLPLRLTGLAVNSPLEILELSEKERSSSKGGIRVALECGGCRDTIEGDADSTLEFLILAAAEGKLKLALAHCVPDLAGVTVVYMRQSFSSIHTTSLGSMGLRAGGSALLRLNVPVAALPSLSPKEELAPIDHSLSQNATLLCDSKSPGENSDTAMTLPPISEPPGPSPPPPSEPSVSLLDKMRARGARGKRGLIMLRETLWDEDCGPLLLRILTLLDNLLSKPGDASVRRLNRGHRAFELNVGRHEGAREILAAVGFLEDGNFLTLSQEGDESEDITLGVRNMVALEGNSMGLKVPPTPSPVDPLTILAASREAVDKASREKAALAAWDPFKGLKVSVGGADGDSAVSYKVLGGGSSSSSSSSSSSIFRSPPSSSSMASGGGAKDVSSDKDNDKEGMAVEDAADSGIDRKVKELRRRAFEIMEAAVPSISRDTIILPFTPRSISSPQSDERISGSGSGMVEENDPEAESLQREYLSRKLMEQKEKSEKGFMTRAMSELDALKKSTVFTQAQIRVQFPDRTVFQGTFSPLETLGEVYKWIVGLLRDWEECRNDEGGFPKVEDTIEKISSHPRFYLFTRPPVSPLLLPSSGKCSLLELKLSPASLLYLAWGEDPGKRGAPPPGGVLCILSPAGEAILERQQERGDSATASKASRVLTTVPLVAPAHTCDAEALDEMAANLLGGGGLGGSMSATTAQHGASYFSGGGAGVGEGGGDTKAAAQRLLKLFKK